ncbi:RNA polymerase sigma-70 factor, sigma-E family [Quadrisphaera granulorum]|uniref:RNA polymerase sigma-70 factor (Sigma-E family) n=1 Tax=Quadrisphaera granulorum TaxID=317664 RepID=A0A316ACF3_9ACTN|nr:SigE family RNA polymerase sigma factor [Quadrisphaera granulorum]PWJ54948.1 RNA polymerase sigma-70 factor (sigma-E family) [Quadrisphaera granulorum]SZE95894.1 RNA polymerase sigma-70 factor, sigma-E family [Quadrisphaera granulorum]
MHSGSSPPGSGGAPEGFDAFVTTAYPHLVRLGALLAADAHHGEDLAQTALVQTLRAWSRLHPDGDPAAYTRRVMTHLATKAGRRRWRGEHPTEHSALPDGGVPFTDAVHSAVDAQRLLATLPAHQRAVLVLRFWADLTEGQTAAELGCSVGTVKSRTARALATLRARAPQGQDDDGSRSAPTDLTSWMGTP